MLECLAVVGEHLYVHLKLISRHELPARCFPADRFLRHIACKTRFALREIRVNYLTRKLLREARQHLVVDDLAHQLPRRVVLYLVEEAGQIPQL